MSLLELEYKEQAPVGWKNSIFPAGRTREVPRRSPLVDGPLPEPKWRAVTAARLHKLLRYRAGWDGYGGKPPKANVIGFVQSVLESTMSSTTPPPSVVPMSGGGVQLEWHTGGFDIELTVYAPFQAELSVEYPDGREPLEEQAITGDFSALGALMAELA